MLTLTKQGLHCPAGGFHIDPTGGSLGGVELALITHAHSDHARRGSRAYLTARSGVGLLRARLGPHAEIRTVEFGERMKLGDTTVSFHPAGHILGSAQIRIERDSHVWVASGDYKREADPSCEAFETVVCDTFVTEATFGTPGFRWGDPAAVIREIHAWWRENAGKGLHSLLYGYALGKTQRILAGLHALTQTPVFVFGEAHALTECYRREGIALVPTLKLEDFADQPIPEGSLIIAPHSIGKTQWLERIGPHESAFASGWMKSGGFGADHGDQYGRGFVLSDHADWDALVRTVRETGARRVLVQHRGNGALVRHLRGLGLWAAPATPEAFAEAAAPVQTSFFDSMQ